MSSAVESGFGGIELHDTDTLSINDSSGIFSKYRAAETSRELAERRIEIPCIDVVCDISSPDVGANAEEISRYIDAAKYMKIPFIRIHALDNDTPESDANSEKTISSVLEKAEEAGVVLLVETAGIYADTSRLVKLLDTFASDSVAALWDLHHPYKLASEAPSQTIKNLGAYVRHVHIKDASDGEDRFCLIGEGSLPLGEMFEALRSINYDGYVSLEWDPKWMPELDDIDIILTHFSAAVRKYGDTDEQEPAYYYNKSGTGRFIWKKEQLVDMTFSQLLDRTVEAFPDQCAFRYTTLDYTRTYAEFSKDVDEFARALISLGVRSGDKVTIWATNLPQWYLTFWATTKIGAILVTMNTAYKIHEAEYLLRQSDTHTLVMMDGFRDSDYSGIIGELCPELEHSTPGKPLHCRRLPFLRNVITVGFEKKGCLTWDDALLRAENTPTEELARRASRVNSHDVCNMQYTSGTTGFPKGVMLTHYNIVNNGKCIGDRMDLSTADRMMIQVPMFHCFGMVLAMTATVTHGGTILPLPYFSPKPALSCIHNERVTAFHGVPTMFIAMLEHEDFPKTDFSCIRTGIMAGSPCPIAIMREVVEKMNMTDITIVYGQTEASPGCTMSSTEDSIEVRVNTVGHNLPEIECKIVDPETGKDLPDNVTGEFVARGYNIMKGYYKMPKETAEAIDADGWLHTGDLACRTPEGNYRITGRLKDMIIRGGENIYPKEIEEFIYTHPSVKDVQVIGVPDESYGEEIMACIILKDGESITEDEMKQYIRDHMAKHKVPKYIDFVDEFPMNAAGKILKYKMRENAIEKYGLQKAADTVTA